MVNKRPTSKSTNGQVRNRRSQAQGAARTPLLPLGVNNQSTMPTQAGTYTYSAEEVISIVNVAAGSTTGQTLYNGLITPESCKRLSILSSAWQRIDWMRASVHLVALNGSLVQSGYTMGFLEDPEAVLPTSAKDLIPYLTALRSTTVRQNWVESTAGVQVGMPDKPEMYTSRGSDPRRYSPGRLVVAIAGDVGSDATFQIMLKYTVRLYVPFAAASADVPATYFTGSRLSGNGTNFTIGQAPFIPIYDVNGGRPPYVPLPVRLLTGSSVATNLPSTFRVWPAGTPVIFRREGTGNSTRYYVESVTITSTQGNALYFAGSQGGTASPYSDQDANTDGFTYA